MAKNIPTPLADEIREKFIQYYQEREHEVIPNVSLVPNVDSTLLFTNSGMFPLVNYLAGVSVHPQGNRLVNFQRCLRTGDEDLAEIGDWKHTTMFEMMGNWSIGDYFKEQQIPWVMDLYINRFGLDPKKMYVSVFAGDDDAPRDEEAIKLWQQEFKKYGVEAKVAPVMIAKREGKDYAYWAEKGQDAEATDWEFGADPEERIFMYDKSENWWQRGDTVGELGGPDSEMFYDTGGEHDSEAYGVAHPNSDSAMFLEIGNSVFMQYKLDDDLNWQELPQKNVDFGGGFSRILLCKQELNDIYATEIFAPIIAKISEISGQEYLGQDSDENTRYFRIIADHIFGATFVIGDGVEPSNKDQGYILRRLIRRAIRMGLQLEIEANFLSELVEVVVGIYQRHYPHLQEAESRIKEVLSAEEDRFRKTLRQGVKELQKVAKRAGDRGLTGKQLFYVYETYGFPVELSLEELEIHGDAASKLLAEFAEAEEKHREASRSASSQKFKGGLADSSEQTTRLHTAHHLLLKALQLVLGEDVHQKGSNITAERLRIDFSYGDKMTPEQKQEVEDIVNKSIHDGFTVERVELEREIAEQIGAEMEFGQNYGERVNVYFIGDFEPGLAERLAGKELAAVKEELANIEIFSKEFCGGPHVDNTSELAEMGYFQINKEQSSGAGVRRIKASLRISS